MHIFQKEKLERPGVVVIKTRLVCTMFYDPELCNNCCDCFWGTYTGSTWYHLANDRAAHSNFTNMGTRTVPLGVSFFPVVGRRSGSFIFIRNFLQDSISIHYYSSVAVFKMATELVFWIPRIQERAFGITFFRRIWTSANLRRI